MKLLALATLPLMLSNCMVVDYGPQAQGNGAPVTEARTLPAFTRVEVDAPVHVIVKTGSDYQAYVTSDGNLSDVFRTEVYGGTLTIDLNADIEPNVEPLITVIAPNLTAVVHNGGGLVEVEEDRAYPDLSLTVNGGGSLYFSGTASELSAAMNGSGDLSLAGFADHLDARNSAGGSIQAQNLLASDAQVDLNGWGDVLLDLDYGAALHADISGSGNVEWWGAPNLLDYSLPGSGKVIEHRGLPKKSAAAKQGADGHVGAAKTGADSLKPYDNAAPTAPKAIPFAEAKGKK